MIPHNRPTLGEHEAEAAAAAVSSGFVARGPQVRALEEELCAWLGLPQGCAALTSSGTAALYLALLVTGARARRVALPAYACAALRNATAMIGAQTHLVDCAPEDPNIDLAALERSGCDAAIVPHMYGVPCDASALKIPATFIDDAAQAMGARINGRPAGCAGAAGVFSFYATKLITTAGTGGAVVSNDPALIAAVHDYLDFDCRRDERERFNFQIGDVQAAVGRVQLKRLHGFIERRAEIFSAYASSGVPMLGTELPAASTPVRYRAIVRSDNAQALIAHLESHGIAAIVPTNDWELPQGYFPNALHLARTTVSLPIYPSLSDNEVRTVVEALRSAA